MVFESEFQRGRGAGRKSCFSSIAFWLEGRDRFC